MARAARQLSESGYMHLIVRGIGRQVLFEDRMDRVSKGTVLIDTPQLIGYDENKGEKWRWRERHGS